MRRGEFSAALLAALADHPGQAMTSESIWAASAVHGVLPRSNASAIISTQVKRGGGDWSLVRRVGHGRYVYDPKATFRTPAETREAAFQRVRGEERAREEPSWKWQEVARDETAIVLRGPDGLLYTAHRITAVPDLEGADHD